MEEIAIIGMGTSGMAVAAAYAKEVESSTIKLDCYDEEDSFGRGFPYREDSDELILNLKTDKISYDYENNNDFINWIKENDMPLRDYSSRSLFGLYTKDRLQKTLYKIDANKILEKVKTLDWIRESNKWQLETINGNKKLYDRVHLCAGELPQKDNYGLKGAEKYINRVYPVNKNLKHIKKNDSATIIGLGLTGVDIATYLLSDRDIRKLYMFSRTNTFPTVRVAPVEIKVNFMTYDKVLQIINKGNGLISFQEFDDLFNRELKSHGIDYKSFINKHMLGGIKGLKINIKETKDLAKVQALLPAMNLTFNKVWVSLTQTDRRMFRGKYHPFMSLNRSPLPLPSAKLLIKAHESGKLNILNNISNIKPIEEGNYFHLLSGGNIKDIVVKTDWICNATGLDTSLKSLDKKDTLLGNMLNKRYLQRDDYGGVTVLAEDMSAVSPRFGRLATLHVHGVLVSGVQYRNNSTLIIQKTAHDLIKKLY